MQKTTNSVRLESNGRKSWENTIVLTYLEGAKTEFREAEIVHRVNLVWQGWTYLRWDQRKANSSKFQEIPISHQAARAQQP